MHYRSIQFNNSDFPLLFFLLALYCFKRLNRAGGWAGIDTSSAALPNKDIHSPPPINGGEHG